MENLKVFNLNTDTITLSQAMKRLYERAVNIPDQLDDIHGYTKLFIEALENAVRNQDLYLFIDRKRNEISAQAFFQDHLLTKEKIIT